MKIIKSNYMTTLGGLENLLIRVPQNIRKELNIECGEIITINGVGLQVDKAIKSDIELHGEHQAFVSETTYYKINALEKQQIEKKLTLGCDPEFFIIDALTYKLTRPNAFFNKYSQVGFDGMLAELRPNYDVSPRRVTENLRELLIKAKDRLNKKHPYILWAASTSFNITAGFHCHLGLPDKELLYRGKYAKKENLRIIKTLVKALDTFVAPLSILPEGEEDTFRRTAQHLPYGKVGDFRVNTRTLEYRVPGGALLKDPNLACGILTLCKVVTEHILDNIDFVKNNKTDEALTALFNTQIPSAADLFSLVCVPTISQAKRAAESIIPIIDTITKTQEDASNVSTYMHSVYTNIYGDINTNWFKP